MVDGPIRLIRLSLTGNGMPIQTSAEAFETSKQARADGLIELGQLVKTAWMRPNLKLKRP